MVVMQRRTGRRGETLSNVVRDKFPFKKKNSLHFNICTGVGKRGKKRVQREVHMIGVWGGKG